MSLLQAAQEKKSEYAIVCLEVNRIIWHCRLLDKMVSKFLPAKKTVSTTCMPSKPEMLQLQC